MTRSRSVVVAFARVMWLLTVTTMSQIRRFSFPFWTTIAMAAAAIIHFRVGVAELYPMAQNDFSGPFTPAVDALEFIVPITIAAILLATWAWVFYGPVQEERVTRRAPRR